MSSADTETEAEAPPRDEVREGLLERLRAGLGDALVDSHVEKGDLWVRVERDAWHRAVEVCKRDLACDYFCFLSGLDWMPSSAPNPEAEVADEDEAGDGGDAIAPAEPEQQAAAAEAIETGYTGGDTRFQVFARVYDPERKIGITVKADLDEDNPTVETITPLFRGADWHEREAWEMFGFGFDGHPGLRHLYLPTEFEGFPLRKDFPLLAREVKPWPGLVDVEPIPAHLMPSGDEGGEAAS